MTDLITEARELCEKATPGEWKVNLHNEDYEQGYGETTFFVNIGGTLLKIGIADTAEKYTEYSTLSTFIARSRTLIPELCDALEKAEKDAQRWISVSERLPEASGAYWVNLHQEDEDGNDADFCIEAWYQVNSLLFAPKEVGWQLLNEWYEFSGQMRQYISHWMPLPAPPEKEGAEQ